MGKTFESIVDWLVLNTTDLVKLDTYQGDVEKSLVRSNSFAKHLCF